jgi:hypothetical protein
MTGLCRRPFVQAGAIKPRDILKISLFTDCSPATVRPKCLDLPNHTNCVYGPSQHDLPILELVSHHLQNVRLVLEFDCPTHISTSLMRACHGLSIPVQMSPAFAVIPS